MSNAVFFIVSAIVVAVLLGTVRAAFWPVVAWIATRPGIRRRLIDRAMKTPYSHIASADGSEVYMLRYWLFNAYAAETGERKEGAKPRAWWRELLPAVRIHCIRREDRDRHLHDHPWDARTIILDGWYREERYAADDFGTSSRYPTRSFLRTTGDTEPLRYGEFHRITHVKPGGVWTMFITWRYRGTWGFDVDGVKVPWREYLKGRGQ